jgi:hypothetical protein
LADNNKQSQQVHDASWDLVNSFRDINQTVMESLVNFQDRNVKFTQNIFLNWMELLSQQTESMQNVQQQWAQQFRKQQDAYQKLATASMQTYMDFFLAPLSFSRQLVEATEGAMQQERELAPR